MEKNLEVVINEVKPIIREVGAFIKDAAGKVRLEEIEHKSLNNLVSYVDKTAEERLVKALGPVLPKASFITEEGTVEQGTTEWKWIIDPLDGTTNFLHQIPLFSISIGLMKGDEMQCGWVLDIMHDQLFYAWKDGGAYMNGQSIQVSQQEDFVQSLFVTGFPYGANEMVRGYMDVLHEITLKTRGLRRLGSAAIDLAYVACGKFEGFYEHKLNAWDVSAGVLIVQEAGGVVTDFNGGDDYIFGGQIVATNRHIHEQLRTIIAARLL